MLTLLCFICLYGEPKDGMTATLPIQPLTLHTSKTAYMKMNGVVPSILSISNHGRLACHDTLFLSFSFMQILVAHSI